MTVSAWSLSRDQFSGEQLWNWIFELFIMQMGYFHFPVSANFLNNVKVSKRIGKSLARDFSLGAC